MTVPQITENWIVITEKFNSKSLKKEVADMDQPQFTSILTAKPEIILIN
jgi:hypothetical protein